MGVAGRRTWVRRLARPRHAGGVPTDPALHGDDREQPTTAAPAPLVGLAAASSRIVGERDAAAVPLRGQGELLGALLGGRRAPRPPLTAADAATLQVLADVAAARLGVMDQAIAARARELAVLDPTWRLPPEQAGDFVLIAKN